MANNTLSSVNIEDSIEILKLGMKYHPDYWKFPEMIGFNYFYHLKDPHRAARYYEQAARLPGHPPYVPSLSGKFYQESGRYEDALRVLYNFYSTTEDKRLKKSFKNYIEAVQEKIRLKQFQLTALISKVLDGQTVEFQPDADNPRFQFLRPEETLRLVGVKPYDIHSANEKKKLSAYFQWDYARLVLEGASVKIEFERRPGGGLKRDKDGRYRGSVILSDNRMYRYPADASDVPNVPEEIELKDILKHRRKIVRLRYQVARVEIGEGNVYLHSGSAYRNSFTAVIPLEFIKRFSPGSGTAYFKSLTNRWVKVTGVVGLHDRQVRMHLYLPSQLEIF
ncbi:MAG: hypothetical protein GY950_23515 [bacterium]|nr:hypothetical protein [bacterium]